MKKEKKKKDNPYLSSAEQAERDAFDRRNFRIKLALAVGVPIALFLLYLFFNYATGIRRG